MILKKLKRTNFEKPKATMIAALVDYIFAEKDEYGNDKLDVFRSVELHHRDFGGAKK